MESSPDAVCERLDSKEAWDFIVTFLYEWSTARVGDSKSMMYLKQLGFSIKTVHITVPIFNHRIRSFSSGVQSTLRTEYLRCCCGQLLNPLFFAYGCPQLTTPVLLHLSGQKGSVPVSGHLGPPGPFLCLVVVLVGRPIVRRLTARPKSVPSNEQQERIERH